MVCGTCGATIADKAIVCYRCGTATAIPAPPPRPAPPPASRPWLLIAVLAAVAVMLGWFASMEMAGTARQVVAAAAAGVALLWAAHLAWHGRRRH